MIPELALNELEGAQVYMKKNGKCVYCDLIAEEKKLAQRIVAENDFYIAFCSFAPRFPYETWILPKTHKSAFDQENNFSSLANKVPSFLD